MMDVHAQASRDRWEAEQREHGMELQERHGSPASDGPGDASWQMVLRQLDQAKRNDARMS
jgi:hypothetical protein